MEEMLKRANVDEKTLKDFYRLSHDSTIADEDGNRFDLREVFLDPPNPTDANYEERMRIRNSDLFKEFAQFPRELHLIYKRVVDTYAVVGEQYMKDIQGQLLDTTVDDITGAVLCADGGYTIKKLNEKINDGSATEEDKEKARKQRDEIEERILTSTEKLKASEFFNKRSEPFLPLVRRGDYWIKEKVADPEFTKEKETIEKLKKMNAPQAEISKEKLEAGKNAGRSWSFETERAAKRKKRELEKGGKDPNTNEELDPVVFENDYGDNGVFTRS